MLPVTVHDLRKWKHILANFRSRFLSRICQMWGKLSPVVAYGYNLCENFTFHLWEISFKSFLSHFDNTPLKPIYFTLFASESSATINLKSQFWVELEKKASLHLLRLHALPFTKVKFNEFFFFFYDRTWYVKCVLRIHAPIFCHFVYFSPEIIDHISCH